MDSPELISIFAAGKERSARHWLAFWGAPSSDLQRIEDVRRHSLQAVMWCAGEDGLLDLAIDLATAMNEHMLWQGQWRQWEAVLRLLLSRSNPTGVSDQQFALREALSAVCFRQHRLEESIALSGENHRRAKQYGLGYWQVKAAINLAEAHLNAGAAMLALAYAEEAGALSALAGERWQEADALINAARALTAMDRLAEAEQRLWQGHALATAAGLKVYQAKAHLFLGQAAGRRNCWGESLPHFQAALDLVTSYGDEVGRATVQSNIGRALIELNRWQEAADFLEDAVRVFRFHGNAPAERMALQRLQELETRRSNHSKSLQE